MERTHTEVSWLVVERRQEQQQRNSDARTDHHRGNKEGHDVDGELAQLIHDFAFFVFGGGTWLGSVQRSGRSRLPLTPMSVAQWMLFASPEETRPLALAYQMAF